MRNDRDITTVISFLMFLLHRWLFLSFFFPSVISNFSAQSSITGNFLQANRPPFLLSIFSIKAELDFHWNIILIEIEMSFRPTLWDSEFRCYYRENDGSKIAAVQTSLLVAVSQTYLPATASSLKPDFHSASISTHHQRQLFCYQFQSARLGGM